MAFSDVFLVLAVIFAAIVLLVPLARKPAHGRAAAAAAVTRRMRVSRTAGLRRVAGDRGTDQQGSIPSSAD